MIFEYFLWQNVIQNLILMNLGFWILQIGQLEAEIQKTVIPSAIFFHIHQYLEVGEYLGGRPLHQLRNTPTSSQLVSKFDHQGKLEIVVSCAV